MVMTPLPPKQGLKHPKSRGMSRTSSIVMTPLPPKQGLKLPRLSGIGNRAMRYDTTSTKTRIETCWFLRFSFFPPCYDTTSTKTRIETSPNFA